MRNSFTTTCLPEHDTDYASNMCKICELIYRSQCIFSISYFYFTLFCPIFTITLIAYFNVTKHKINCLKHIIL